MPSFLKLQPYFVQNCAPGVPNLFGTPGFIQVDAGRQVKGLPYGYDKELFG